MQKKKGQIPTRMANLSHPIRRSGKLARLYVSDYLNEYSNSIACSNYEEVLENCTKTTKSDGVFYATYGRRGGRRSLDYILVVDVTETQFLAVKAARTDWTKTRLGDRPSW
jgi:hypothetical protein